MLDKPWVPGFPPQQQTRYQTVHDCKYWPVLGCFNNLNIITLLHKAMKIKAFGEIHQVFLDEISDNTFSVQSGRYGATNTTYSEGE